jgi:transcriptional regulator with XRE-family HTH domain
MGTLASKLLPIFRGNVEVALKRLNWGRADLAEAMGVTPSHVTQVLGGHRGVGLETIDKIADALGVPASDLLKSPKPARRAS